VYKLGIITIVFRSISEVFLPVIDPPCGLRQRQYFFVFNLQARGGTDWQMFCIDYLFVIFGLRSSFVFFTT
jgi:hypothetical protein